MKKLLFLLLTIPVLCSAEEITPQQHMVMEKAAEGFIECSAYFHTLSTTLKRANKPDLSEKYYKAAERIFYGGLNSANKIMSKEESEKFAKKWFAYNGELMQGILGPQAENFSKLNSMYFDKCIAIYKDPVAFIEKLKPNPSTNNGGQ